jgi:hypothetical protein
VAFFLPARLRAHWAPGIPCALSLEGQDVLASLAQKTCGEIAELWLRTMLFEKSDPLQFAERKRTTLCVVPALSRDPITTGLSRCAKAVEQRLSQHATRRDGSRRSPGPAKSEASRSQRRVRHVAVRGTG